MRETSRMQAARMVLGAVLVSAGAGLASAQDAFDACELFTEAEAKLALGGSAEPEPQNPKARRPRVVNTCTWWSSRDGKNISATANFRFARSEAEVRPAFDDERLNFQSKPLLIAGAPAFWSARQGVLQVLKGRVWLVVTVGGAKPTERDEDASRKLAEALVNKL